MRILSGVQSSGRLHIGNYLGAISNFVKLGRETTNECLFFVADLHSLSEKFNPTEKNEQIINLFASYIALGVSPISGAIFIQSHVKEHTELMWLLSTIATFGELRRMTQFKDKSSKYENDENISLALFTYPVLMASDILLYRPDIIPVGEDQLQHLELTRDLGRRFNNKFGDFFKEVKGLVNQNSRVMDLKDPKRKMSKSEPTGCLFLDDEEIDVINKIKRATTDSMSDIILDVKNKPGISNLLGIMSEFSGKSISELENNYKGKNYGEFKKDVAQTVVPFINEFRKKKKEVLENREIIEIEMKKGAEYARNIANKNISKIKEMMGLI